MAVEKDVSLKADIVRIRRACQEIAKMIEEQEREEQREFRDFFLYYLMAVSFAFLITYILS